MRHDALGAAGFLLAATAACALGSLAARTAVQQYLELRHPSWMPPPWICSPSWAVLYLLIALSGWLVWRKAGGWLGARLEMGVYSAQLSLNMMWKPLLFATGRYDLAAIEIVVLLAVIIANVVLFARCHRGAALLLVPYLAWTLYVTALNFTTWTLNG